MTKAWRDWAGQGASARGVLAGACDPRDCNFRTSSLSIFTDRFPRWLVLNPIQKVTCRKFCNSLSVINRRKSGAWVRQELSCLEVESSGVISVAAMA